MRISGCRLSPRSAGESGESNTLIAITRASGTYTCIGLSGVIDVRHCCSVRSVVQFAKSLSEEKLLFKLAFEPAL